MYKKNKVLAEFFKKPTVRFHIRELARLTKIHPNTIIKLTDELEKESVIIKKRYKNLIEAQANIESEHFIREKRLFNISQINKCGLLDHLISFYNNPRAIVLYGSFARGEDIEKSDIDMAVITKEKKTSNLILYEKKLEKNIHLFCIDYSKISDEFYTSLINGIVLHGYIEPKK